MNFRMSTFASLTILAVLCAPLRAAYTPIDFTGYNQDMIVEAGAATGGSLAGTATTASMDNGTGNTGPSWYEIGYNAGAPTTGLPIQGTTFTSEADADHTFQLADDFTAANAVMLDPTHTTATLTLTNPKAYSSLSVLTSSSRGPGTVDYTIHYADASTSTGSFVSLDWYNGAITAVTANGRVNVQTGGFDTVNGGNPRLYQVDLAVPITNQAITSLEFTGFTPSQTGSFFTVTAVLALSGVEVIPTPAALPAGLALLGTFVCRRRRRA